jgi:hypothetical protein
MNVPHRIVLIEKPQASEPVPVAEQPGFIMVLPAPPGGRSGRGGEVISLSNRRRLRSGGHSPAARQVLTAWQVTGPVMIGHTTSYDDPDAPILVREADIMSPRPGSAGYAEGRCTDCIARPVIARGEDQTLLVLEHEPGCPWMAGLLRQAGRRP